MPSPEPILTRDFFRKDNRTKAPIEPYRKGYDAEWTAGILTANLFTGRQAVPAYLGRGFKSLTGEVLGSQTIEIPEAMDPPGAGRTEWRIVIISDKTLLRHTLGVSVGGAISGLGSASAEFYSSHSVDTFSLYIYAHVYCVLNKFIMGSYPLDPQAAKQIQRGEPSKIYRSFGDRFVGEVSMGGRYFVLLRYYAQTEEDFTQMKGKAEGAVGIYSGQAGFSEAIHKLHEYKSENAWHLLEGVKGGYPQKEDVVTYLRQFPDKVAKDQVSVPVELGTYGIAEAKGWDVRWNAPDVFRASKALERLLTTHEEIDSLKTKWKDVQLYPYHYKGRRNADKAATAIDALDDTDGKLVSSATSILFAPTTVTTTPTLSIPKKAKALPEKVPTFPPTIVASFTILYRERGHGEGKIVSSGSSTIMNGDPLNIDNPRNWIHARSGSYANLRSVTVDLKKPLPYVDLRYRGLYSQGPTEWVLPGTPLWAPDKISLLVGMEFALVGEMQDAYWFEYQIHAMNLGDSAIHGNTERAEGRLKGFAQHDLAIEGIRINIWPR
jgi:hypothetical protein